MSIPLPALDDRSYDEILAEAKARIPVHTPEWTNFNDSDPGITLLQLSSWIMENALWRINLIPERNRRKFLDLLGIPLRPPAAAQGLVTFTNERGPLETVMLPGGIQVLAGQTGFGTENALDVLPVEAQVFYRRKLTDTEKSAAQEIYDQLYDSYRDLDIEGNPVEEVDPEFYETTQLDAPLSIASLPEVRLRTDTVDASVWVALLARHASELDQAKVQMAGRILTLGVMPKLNDDDGVVARPGGAESAVPVAVLAYELSTGQIMDGKPVYLPLPARADADPLQSLSLVELPLPDVDDISVWKDFEPLTNGVGDYPPLLDDETVSSRIVAWIRVRVRPAAGRVELPEGVTANLSWLGINAARLAQRIDVGGEFVGTGNGEPDQTFVLMNRPVLPDTVVLSVNGRQWQRTEDLLSARPEVPVRDPSLPPVATTTRIGSPRGFTIDRQSGEIRLAAPQELSSRAADASGSRNGDPRVFSIDRQSGEIRFGDGLHGMRPPRGAQIFASYAYGGGKPGNVSIGAIKTAPGLPAGFKVENPLPTWGGTDGESIIEAERTIPARFRHRQRAVSQQDYEQIIADTPGVEIGRVNVRAHYHPEIGSPAPGVVTVMVIPKDTAHPEGPRPDPLFLAAICRHLEPARVLTTEVHVRGPDYVDVSVSVGVDVVPGHEIAKVVEAVKQEVRLFLSPLEGGFNGNSDEKGWPLDHPVDEREILVRAARVDGVNAVRQVLLWGPDGGEPTPAVPIIRLELPRLVNVGAATGEPDDLFAAEPSEPPTTRPKRRLPVPTVPPEC